jgi:membrane protein DedA with SNARE-associated domain
MVTLARPLALSIVLGAACLSDALWYRVGQSKRASGVLERFGSKKAAQGSEWTIKLLKYGMLGGLLTGKFSPLPSSLVPFVAGTTRFPGARFLVLATAANVVWTSVFFFGGFLGGTAAARFLGLI